MVMNAAFKPGQYASFSEILTNGSCFRLEEKLDTLQNLSHHFGSRSVLKSLFAVFQNILGLFPV